VKLDSQQTPPPLYYSPVTSDRGRESTADTTPVSTPVEAALSPPGRKREKDLLFSWHVRRKPHELGSGHHSVELNDSDLLFDDAGDCSFPLFPESPPRHSAHAMATAASPIDISTPPRFNSTSPRNPASNLTYALQGASAHDYNDAMNVGGTAIHDSRDGRLSVGGRHDSISNGLGGSYYGGSGARPISMKDRPRRESNTGSFAGGMSWGGISVGSFIRDE
jgi:transcription factor SFP1